MQLTDGEKLIAFMLADLMKGLKVNSEIDPDLVLHTIATDNPWALRWQYGSIFHGEGPSDDVVDETASIMTMCRVMENSIRQLSPEELAQIDEYDRTVFQGFDGNHEPHYGVADMLVNQLGRFPEWKDRSLNSHSSSIDDYREMRERFDQMKRGSRGLLSLDQIKKALGKYGKDL